MPVVILHPHRTAQNRHIVEADDKSHLVLERLAALSQSLKIIHHVVAVRQPVELILAQPAAFHVEPDHKPPLLGRHIERNPPPARHMQKRIGHRHVNHLRNQSRITRPKQFLRHLKLQIQPLLLRQRQVTLRNLSHVFRYREYFHIDVVTRLARLPEIMQHVDDVRQLLPLTEYALRPLADIFIRLRIVEYLLARHRKHEDRTGYLLRQILHQMKLRVENLLLAFGLDALQCHGPSLLVPTVPIANDKRRRQDKQQHIQALRNHARIPRSPMYDQQRPNRSHIPRHHILVTHVQPVTPRMPLGKLQVRGGLQPAILHPLDMVEIDIVAAVDVVQRNHPQIIQPLVGAYGQYAVPRHGLVEGDQPVVDPHVTEQQIGIERFALVARLLHDDKPVRAAEKQLPAGRVLPGRTVTVLNRVDTVGVTVTGLRMRRGIVAQQTAVRRKVKFAVPILQDSMDDVADRRLAHRTILP